MPPELDMNYIYQTFKEIVPYRIRQMHEHDIATVVIMERTTWPDLPWSSEYLINTLDDPRHMCWIIERTMNDHSILGYGFLLIENDTSHITNLCIDPNQRGCGFGKILLRHMIEYSREIGASLVHLEVDTNNDRAIQLYSTHGFRITRRLYKYYSDDSDAYHMTLFLQ